MPEKPKTAGIIVILNSIITSQKGTLLQHVSTMTISEFAKIADVAKSSVSKALNGKKGVSEETRKKILNLAKELDFQPNQAAKSLAQNKTNTIGFVLPQEASYSMAGEYWTGIMTAVAENASKAGYTLMIITPPYGTSELFSRLKPLVKRHAFDGLIIGAEQLDCQSIEIIQQEKIPLVFVGQNNDVNNYYSVQVDSITGSKLLVEKLISQGCKKIGCFSGPEEYLYIQDRIQGFSDAIKEAGLSEAPVFYSTYYAEPAYENAVKFFTNNSDLDGLYITAGGTFAMKVLNAFSNVYKNIENKHIAVFDDSLYFDFLNYNIITARQPLEKVGREAFEVLLHLMNKQKPEKEISILGVELITRHHNN